MVNMPLAQLQVFIAFVKWLVKLLVKLLKQLIDKFAVTCMSKYMYTCRHATFEKLLRDLKTVITL